MKLERKITERAMPAALWYCYMLLLAHANCIYALVSEHSSSKACVKCHHSVVKLDLFQSICIQYYLTHGEPTSNCSIKVRKSEHSSVVVVVRRT